MANYPKIKSRKIKYSNSPSGYATIGKYIPPFEKNDSGFGFKGVLIEDSESGKIECSICGKWFDQLAKHLETHNTDSVEYKRRFGLLSSTALKSKEMRLNQSKVMVKLRKENKRNRYTFQRGNSHSANRKGNPKAVESKNKFGVCELQVIERITELAKELGKTPTLMDLRERYGAGMISLIHSRYKSYIKICNNLGLEVNFSNYNPKYSREYFIEKALSNEPSFRIFTINEGRAFYRYFKGIKELKQEAIIYGK